MINKTAHFVVISFFLLLFSGCEKSPINNSVEQQWILEEFTTFSDNQTIQCKRLFFNITFMVTLLEEKQGLNGYQGYVARTNYIDKDSLILSDFKVRRNTSDSKTNATAEQLKPFGINNPKKTAFSIEKLTHGRMILKSDYALLKLKKF